MPILYVITFCLVHWLRLGVYFLRSGASTHHKKNGLVHLFTDDL
jgi:hypothetical protein